MEEVPRKCVFCNKENPPYTCPRCQQPYCCVKCFRDPDHLSCSEGFYKNWVETSLASDIESNEESKLEMVKILQRIQKEDEDEELDSDDYDEDLNSLNERLLSQLDINKVDDLWENLSANDKEAIKDILDTQDIPLWDPWWQCKSAARKLVSEVGTSDLDVSSPGPKLPINIPKLSTLTTRVPSLTVQYQVLNVLAAYTFVCRLYNGDHQDEAVEASKVMFQLSSVLENSSTFGNAAESIYKLRECKEDLGLNERSLRSVFEDVCDVLMGPVHDRTCHFVSAALSDTHHLLKTSKLKEHTEGKKKVNLALKKLEYLLSWTQDFGPQFLKQNIPLLQLEIVSLTEDMSSFERTEKLKNESHLKITEIDVNS